MYKSFLLLLFLFTVTATTLHAQQQEAQAKEALTQLLHEFMEGASENDPEMHDRFWAEDLIYTSSSGQRFGKAEIMAGFSEVDDTDSDPQSPSVTYTAEDIQIQVYGNMAIVAFRLVGRTETEEGMQTDYYLNSGTFLKRDGQWKVVNWQATRVPE